MALGTAVIVGVGPGLGLELSRTFANAGHPVAMLARDKAKLGTFAKELASTGQDARGYVTDAADPVNLRDVPNAAISERLPVRRQGRAPRLRGHAPRPARGTGVHATSVTITATIGSAPHFEPAEIAKGYLELDNQPEAEWQHELVY